MMCSPGQLRLHFSGRVWPQRSRDLPPAYSCSLSPAKTADASANACGTVEIVWNGILDGTWCKYTWAHGGIIYDY
jgi:hypothetical protein